MVSMGLKNSLKKQRVLKSPWKLKKIRISLKSPWIVLKAPWTKITLIIKEKVFCVCVFFMMFPAWQFIFRYLKFSRNRAFMGGWYCNKQPPPLYLQIWNVCTSFHFMSNYRKNKSLKNLSWSLKTPWFSPTSSVWNHSQSSCHRYALTLKIAGPYFIQPWISRKFVDVSRCTSCIKLNLK